MHFTNLIASSFALLAATAIAAPTISPPTTFGRFTGTALKINTFVLQRVETGNTTVTFSVTDPDPLSNATTTCTGSWAYDSAAWPEGGYDACKDNSFSWHMADFNSWQDFQIGLEHTIHDPSMGSPPYDRVTNFAVGAFNGTVLPCSAMGGRESCEMLPGTVVRAPITQSIAKRR